MSDFERFIYDALKLFGPCDLRTIQTKLNLRGIVAGQNTINDAAQALVSRHLIRVATGFKSIAYKI